MSWTGAATWILVAALPAAAVGARQETDEAVPEETSPAEGEADADGARAQPEHPCGSPSDGAPDALERTRAGIGFTVCRAAFWFDSLFGDARVGQEADATFGWVRPELVWDEIDGVEPGLGFRAKFSLPRMERRLNAVVARTSREDFIEDSSLANEQRLPEAFRDTDDQWLVGLGYTPVRGVRRRFDVGAGLDVGALEVSVQGRYRRQWFPSDRDLLRFRQTAFWESDDGLGTSSRLDVERLLGERHLVRFRQVGTFAERSDGLAWSSELSLFQRLGRYQGIAYVAEAAGRTDAEVTVERYGASTIYRRRILRDWLFLELRPGVLWRRPQVEDRRQASPFLGVGIELQFGNWPDTE